MLDPDADRSTIRFSPVPDPAGDPAGQPALPVDEDFRVLAQDAIRPVAESLPACCVDLRGFAVFISRAAVTNIMRHGAKGLETEHEVAGGLVGHPGYDAQTGLRFTRIRAAMAVHGRADQYEVEIPPEEWSRLSNYARETRAAQTPAVLVGWYHSHPTFEAYLSAVDQATQRQFFGDDWNIAIVIGPLLRQIKAFHSGHSTPCPLFLDPDDTPEALVPVTYEVSAGGVSTDSGIEWVEPDVLVSATPAPVYPIDPGYADVYANLPYAADLPEAVGHPAAMLPPESLLPPAPELPQAAAPPAALGFSPVVLAMLGVVALLIVVLVLLLVFNGPQILGSSITPTPTP